MEPGSVYVTKDDSREAQSAESKIFGGQVPRGSMAAQMQVSLGYRREIVTFLLRFDALKSAADKIEHVKNCGD